MAAESIMGKLNQHIFVSYARADIPRVAAIIDSLRKAGLDVWIDQEGIKGATFWRKEIVEAIAQCAVVLFFASRNSCTSESVSKELALASEEHKPILPVFLEAVELSADLRFQIAGVQQIAWHENRDIALRQIIAVLESHAPPTVGERRALQPLTLRTPRRSTWPWGFAGIAGGVGILAMLAFMLLQRSVTPSQAVSATTQPSVASNTTLIAPPVSPQQLYQLQNAYYIETFFQTTDYKPFEGMRLHYKVLVTQNGRTLDVRGEKIGEVVNGEERILTGRGKTAIHLTGHVETSPDGATRILLNGEEASTSRSNFPTLFELHPAQANFLTGTFKSNASNAGGSAVWISEKQWQASGWRRP